jgi:hypothetical protein
MFQLRTRGDIVFYLVICTAVFAMGVLMWLFPVPPVPADPAAYREQRGVLGRIVARSGGRQVGVTFELAGAPQRYELRTRRPDPTATWQPGRTRLAFHVLASEVGAQGGDDLPPTVYGLAVDGMVLRPLAADIAAARRPASPWGAALAVGVGLLGYAVSWLTWRRLPGRLPAPPRPAPRPPKRAARRRAR